MTRDALSWALSATVAGAAHLGLAMFILNRIPPSAPPPPETEIMVDMIKVGQAQAQQPAQASAAAEAATGAAVEAQADSADAAQAAHPPIVKRGQDNAVRKAAKLLYSKIDDNV